MNLNKTDDLKVAIIRALELGVRMGLKFAGYGQHERKRGASRWTGRALKAELGVVQCRIGHLSHLRNAFMAGFFQGELEAE